ncbi:MAG: hypothetical protein HS107_00685 [Thermoflexaceae bacterium]|nr:hypothetical protein [Thermoflexaceae bacterium]
MDRRLPAEYDGWQVFEAGFRRMTTPELVQEIQDGSPERRLAALSVIDLAEVAPETLEDWVRHLPAAEAHELAGAIPAQRPGSSCDEDRRWVDLARLGYEERRLPTFLVMLMSSAEALETKRCDGAASTWMSVGMWLETVYTLISDEGDSEALADISLFVFENYLGRLPIFEAFCELLRTQAALAVEVSSNPYALLADLSPEWQREALRAAEEGGGIPAEEAWAVLQGL